MKREVDLFIFDLDGTLSDSKKDLALAINHTLHTYGFDPMPEEEIASLIGKGISKLLTSFSDGDRESNYKTFRTYLEYLENHLLDSTTPFPGVTETLARITKKKAVVTNKLLNQAEKVLTGLGLTPFIDLVVGSDVTARIKPDPAPVLYALERFGVDPSRVVMVGDTPDDILAAVHANVIPCGVTYGFGSREDLLDAGAQILIERFPEIQNYFQ